MTLLFMIFFHIVDDYYLQGVLAKMKQKGFWNAIVKNGLYKNDYIVALVMHAFSWAFMIMLPIAYKISFVLTPFFAISFVCNLCIHAITDHLKANKQVINLIYDQTIHITQIVITYIVFLLV